jgi:hypothetical protein
MSRVILTKVMAASATKPVRVKAQSVSAQAEVKWNHDLTDAANYRYAANHLVQQINAEPYNARNGIKWEIVAGGLMPDGNTYAFIISD